MKPAYAVPTPGVSARDPNNEFAHLEGLDFVVAEESVRTQQTTLKREEAALADELKRAQAAKAVLLREIKRMRDEDGERHCPAPHICCPLPNTHTAACDPGTQPLTLSSGLC